MNACGRLPLALAMIGAMAAHGSSGRRQDVSLSRRHQHTNSLLLLAGRFESRAILDLVAQYLNQASQR